MKAVRKLTPGPGASLVTVPVPEPGPLDVLVKVNATSVCGTDYHIYSWDPWSQGRIKPPLTTGHELAGEVVAVGSQVTTHRVGDFISAETHIVCGHCQQCLTGQYHVCQNTRILGVDTDGAFAQYLSLPASNAWKNDPDLPADVASVQEPLGNAVHTVLSVPITGNVVAVTGCGPIGLMAIAVARLSGATAVFAVDVNDYRLDLARRMGATEVIDGRKEDVVARLRRLSGGGGVDVLLEFSGNPTAINQGLKALRPGGKAAMLGLPSRPLEIDLGNDIVMKGIEVKGIAGRRMYDTWFKVKGLLRGGLDLRPLITHRLPLEAYEDAMELMRQGNCGKVILYPHGVPNN
mgnify:CR=1 FL=1